MTPTKATASQRLGRRHPAAIEWWVVADMSLEADRLVEVARAPC
jgi:hypothetical protein